jgi:hypothetical protein
MKLYCAAINNVQFEELYRAKHKYILLSAYFIFEKNFSSENLRKASAMSDFFLDSGAFSAFSLNKTINIQDYIRLIKELGVKYYAGLDVIGSVEKTAENQKIMEKEGLEPIPTFHMGSPMKALTDMVESYRHIAIGGMVGKRPELIASGLLKYFKVIPNNVKVHGFGYTNFRFLERYPFYSVDSSSWSTAVLKFGRVYFFERNTLRSFGPKEFMKKYGVRFLPNKNKNRYMQCMRHSAIQWKKMADYLEGRENAG